MYASARDLLLLPVLSDPGDARIDPWEPQQLSAVWRRNMTAMTNSSTANNCPQFLSANYSCDRSEDRHHQRCGVSAMLWCHTVSAKSSSVSSPRASSPRCLQKVSCHVSVFSALGNISVVMIVNTFFLPDQLRPLLFLLFFGFEFFVVRVRARACRTCIPRVAREAVRCLLLQCLQCRPLTVDWHQQTVFRGRAHE